MLKKLKLFVGTNDNTGLQTVNYTNDKLPNCNSAAVVNNIVVLKKYMLRYEDKGTWCIQPILKWVRRDNNTNVCMSACGWRKKEK